MRWVSSVERGKLWCLRGVSPKATLRPEATAVHDEVTALGEDVIHCLLGKSFGVGHVAE